MTKVAVIGNGWVGQSMIKIFPDAYVYTRKIGKKEKVNQCDVAFICVPTPSGHVSPSKGEKLPDLNGRLDTSIVGEIIKWCECPLIVIRSTVNPGDTYKWKLLYKKHLVVQPEYLGETPDHPMYNPKTRQFMIIGGAEPDRKKLIDLYGTVYNANINIRQVSDYVAEVIKLTENRAIAFKVAQIQELYDVCQAAQVDFYEVRQAVYGDDPRFNLWWTLVFPNKRGFNSKCIPKDVYAWAAWAEGMGIKPEITNAILERNERWINGNN